MDGTVKWFSEQKGFGFITGSGGNDHYFNTQSVKGSVLPRNGARVAFVPGKGRKGLAANTVEIMNQGLAPVDDRMACPRCGKRIVPRIITNQGVLSHSVCPFCGATVKRFGSWWLWTVMLVLAFLFLVLPALTSR